MRSECDKRWRQSWRPNCSWDSVLTVRAARYPASIDRIEERREQLGRRRGLLDMRPLPSVWNVPHDRLRKARGDDGSQQVGRHEPVGLAAGDQRESAESGRIVSGRIARALGIEQCRLSRRRHHHPDVEEPRERGFR